MNNNNNLKYEKITVKIFGVPETAAREGFATGETGSVVNFKAPLVWN